MKHFSFLILLFCCHSMTAQLVVHNIFDPKVATQKGIINGALFAENALVLNQRNELEKLRRYEKDYNSKRSISANIFSNTLVVSTVELQINTIESTILNIKRNINGATFGLGTYGLSRYKDALEIEEKYFNRIKGENNTLRLGALASGGVGHVYTSYLKLLLRLIKVKNNLLKIDKEVKARTKLTRMIRQ